MRSDLLPSLALLVVFAASCRAEPDTARSPDAEAAATPAAVARQDPAPDTQQAPLWSEEGLAAQSRLAWLRGAVPPELNYTPGSTAWRTAPEPEVPAPPADSPGALLASILQARGFDDELGEDVWEHTSRVWRESEDRAVGVVLRWGMMDDAIAGHDLRVSMRHTDAGWLAEIVEERFHCARGVTPEGLCS